MTDPPEHSFVPSGKEDHEVSCSSRSSRSRSSSRSSKREKAVKGLVLTAAFLCSLLLGSCTALKKQVSLDLPRDSFLFITHKVTYQACDDSRCQVLERRAVGSGFVVDSYGGDSWGLTAGHVCMPPSAIAGHPAESSLTVLLYNGGYHKAEVVGIHPEVDICVLKIPGISLPWVRMAENPPEVGSKITTLSAPLGTMEPGMIPQFDGYYVGITRYLQTQLPGAGVFQAFTLPATGGVSGAPIFNEQNEVVGMSVIALSRFENFALSPPFESLKAVIRSVQDAARHGE